MAWMDGVEAGWITAQANDGDGTGTGVLGGPGLLVWIVLALGAAMLVGNVAAIVRPPPRARDDDLARAPVTRSAVMAAIGLLAAVWALASLLI